MFNVRDARLGSELEAMKRLARESTLIRFQANDAALPDQYYVDFDCVGLAQRDQRSSFHTVHIYLPAEYPRIPPGIRFKTPIFHPNIKAMLDDSAQVARLADTVGGIQNLGRLYHTNPSVREMFDAHICLDVLALNWTPAVTLYDICLELGAMIQYQRYNVDDPLNHEAAEWTKVARTQPGVLPIDNRDLRDRVQRPAVKPGAPPIRISTRERLAP